MNKITRRHALALGSSTLLLPSALRAQPTWPTGPVTFVVGYAAGGGSDINARELAQYHVADHRPADHRRQQGRRHRLDRRARRSQRQARRLDAVLRRRHQRRDQPVGPEGHDRHHRQPGADLPDDVLPVRAGGESQGAGQHGGRAGGAGQEGTGEAHLLLVGSRRQQSSRGRAVRRGRRHPAHPRALQGHRPGAGRRDQRPDHHEFLLAAAGGRPDQGRQPAGRWR